MLVNLEARERLRPLLRRGDAQRQERTPGGGPPVELPSTLDPRSVGVTISAQAISARARRLPSAAPLRPISGKALFENALVLCEPPRDEAHQLPPHHAGV